MMNRVFLVAVLAGAMAVAAVFSASTVAGQAPPPALAGRMFVGVTPNTVLTLKLWFHRSNLTVNFTMSSFGNVFPPCTNQPYTLSTNMTSRVTSISFVNYSTSCIGGELDDMWITAPFTLSYVGTRPMTMTMAVGYYSIIFRRLR